jgi:hypothetical protein
MLTTQTILIAFLGSVFMFTIGYMLGHKTILNKVQLLFEEFPNKYVHEMTEIVELSLNKGVKESDLDIWFTSLDFQTVSRITGVEFYNLYRVEEKYIEAEQIWYLLPYEKKLRYYLENN